jgi:3D (Asp-Asp-Asp) domain-containing protein
MKTVGMNAQQEFISSSLAKKRLITIRRPTMLKCITKCPKGYDRCCHTCELKEFCNDACKTKPEECSFVEDGRELRYKARTREMAKRFWRLYIIGLIAFLALLFTLLVVIGNQNAETIRDRDMLDKLNEISIAEPEESISLRSLGEFTITHYSASLEECGKTDGITFTGTKATAGRTIAVDPDTIPLGSQVVIDGVTYTAEDIGGAIKGKRIDIFVDSKQEAIQRGKIQREVFSL